MIKRFRKKKQIWSKSLRKHFFLKKKEENIFEKIYLKNRNWSEKRV